jgi:2-oxo-4-hydroxy-4-carboxy-5-ureidoimidazoline decarboxylase
MLKLCGTFFHLLSIVTSSNHFTLMSNDHPSVKELLSKPKEEISSFLAGIYEHSAWVSQDLVENAALTDGIDTVTGLANAMKSIVDSASEERKMELLCAHPDLCEKAAMVEDLTAESREEQGRAGLQSLTRDELATFTQMNTLYREKFGFPFILAVRNATKYTVLAALEGRLPNPKEAEFVNALSQVHKIAWMRLLACLHTEDAKGFLTCHVLDTANGCPGAWRTCRMGAGNMLACNSVTSYISCCSMIARSCQDANRAAAIVAP